MSSIDYINALAARGIELWTQDGKLQYKAPKEAITPALLAELKAHKAALMPLLEQFAGTAGNSPLSYSQKSLWALHQINPDSAAYNVTYATQVSDALDVACLARCVDYLIARHPILRTRYAVIDGQPMQQVSTGASVRLGTDRVFGASESDILGWIDREANKPFDLGASPIRLKLLVNEPGAEKVCGPRHVLLLNVHHIAADFWSLEIMVRELRALYDLAVRGEPLKLAPLPVQYKDCVRHEAEHLQGPQGQLLADFWAHELQGELPVLNLATDHPRPPIKTERGQVHSLPFGTRLSHSVRERARQLHVTPYMLLLGVYQLFLFLHTGQPRLLIGAPTAGRQMPGSEGVLGHFVNTVVLSCETPADLSFRDLLARTRSMMLRVMDHQDHPFPLLVERLRPARDPSRSPIFQVMYNWNQVRAGGQSEEPKTVLFGRTLAASSTGTRGATHDLTLNVQDDGSEHVAAWTFNTDLFSLATVERFAQQYLGLVEQVLADVDQPLTGYRTTLHVTRAELLERIARASRQGEGGSPLPAALQALARVQPGHAVWTLSGHAGRAADLAEAVRGLVARLSGKGVRAGSAVALRVPGVAERTIALLAVLELRASLAADEANARFLVDGGGSSWDGWAPEAITIEEQGAALPGGDPAAPEPATASQMSYFMDGLASILRLQDGATPVLLPGTDATLCAAVMALASACGGAVHVAADSIAALSHDDAFVAKDACTKLGQTIASLRRPVLVLPDLLLARLGACDLSALHGVVAVGDHPSALQSFIRSGRAPASGCFIPRFSLTSWLGPLAFDLDPSQQAHWRLRPSSGHYPVPVLMGLGGDLADEHQAGRLSVLTDRVDDLEHAWARTRRYQAHVDLAVALVNHRLVETPLMLTRWGGDLWCACPTARRADRGVQPFEVGVLEAALAAQPEVLVVACALVDQEDASPVLVAWTGLAEGVMPADFEASVRRRLKKVLPDAMHPDAFVFVEHLPLTAEGHLDTPRLPPPEALHGRSGRPSGEIEQTLSAIWKDVLSLPEVGVHQDFFELGGDSILAAVIVSKAALAGLYFQPRHLFEHSTISALASVASPVPQIQSEQGQVTGEQVPGPAAGWFFDRVNMDPSHFNQALLLALRQAPDEALMAEALRLLAQQHDGLRSRFKPHEGRWRQVFDEDAAAVPPRWSVIDCTDDAGRTCPERWQNAVAKAQSGLDIVHGPLWSVHWLEGGSLADSRLLVVVHHLLIDGVSWGILLQDLSDIYTTLAEGGVPALPLKTTSVKEWTGRWLERSGGEAMQADHAHWRALAGRLAAQPDAWRLKGVRGHGDPFQGNTGSPRLSMGRSTAVLDTGLTAAFRTTAHQAYGTDANDLLMAALYAGFQAWSGQGELLVDLEGHGRDSLGDVVDLSRSIGWFTSIYPVALEGAATREPGGLIKHVKEQLRSIPAKGAGHGVLRHLDGAADEALRQTLSAMPPAPVLFTYLGVLDQMTAGACLYAGAVEPAPGIRSARQHPSHPLDMCAYIAGDRLALEIAFDHAALDAGAVDVLAREVRDALVRLISHCLSDGAGGLTPSDLPGLDIDQDGLDALLAEVAALER